MISYNPKNWRLFILSRHRSGTIRTLLPYLIGMAIYSGLIAYLEMEVFRDKESSYLKNMTLLHNLLGFALSMLLVFRTNTAYDRWWEGRKLWGSLVNNSRNLSVKLNALLPHGDTNNRQFFLHLIPRFAYELQRHLQAESTRLELDEVAHPEIPDFDQNKHLPNQVAGLIMGRLQHLHRTGVLTAEQMLLLNPEMMSFLEICGACERIKNTPIPYSYSGFIKNFIFIYIITLPIGYVFSLGYLVIPVVVFIFYVLASLELIAEEIEDPFGKDINDLPTQRLYEMIRKNVKDILS